MKNAIIIHGMPSKEEYLSNETPSESNKHWIPWLQKQLSINSIRTQTPEMPKPYYPVYNDWEKSFEQYEIGKATILIGHSCGGGFLLRFLSEHHTYIDTLVLIAPWIDPAKSLQTGFFDFLIDSHIHERTKRILIFYSVDDDREILKSIEVIKQHIPTAQYVEFTNKGHFITESMKSNEFPELLEVLRE